MLGQTHTIHNLELGYLGPHFTGIAVDRANDMLARPSLHFQSTPHSLELQKGFPSSLSSLRVSSCARGATLSSRLCLTSSTSRAGKRLHASPTSSRWLWARESSSRDLHQRKRGLWEEPEGQLQLTVVVGEQREMTAGGSTHTAPAVFMARVG